MEMDLNQGLELFPEAELGVPVIGSHVPSTEPPPASLSHAESLPFHIDADASSSNTDSYSSSAFSDSASTHSDLSRFGLDMPPGLIPVSDLKVPENLPLNFMDSPQAGVDENPLLDNLDLYRDHAQGVKEQMTSRVLDSAPPAPVPADTLMVIPSPMDLSSQAHTAMSVSPHIMEEQMSAALCLQNTRTDKANAENTGDATNISARRIRKTSDNTCTSMKMADIGESGDSYISSQTSVCDKLKTVPSLSGDQLVGQTDDAAGHIAPEGEKMDITEAEPEISTEMMDMDRTDQNEDAVALETEEPEFIWEDYLEETGATAVPHTAFQHVEISLQSGFAKGMKLEVPNKGDSSTYWVASVIITCGPLMRLRWEGYFDDSSADFWCPLSSEIHPIGWCSQNDHELKPPEVLCDRDVDWSELLVTSLTGAPTVPSYLLNKNTGTTPIDQIQQGMRLECQHMQNPLHVWIVKVLENVGGRLYLRYEGAETALEDFWLFYLDYHLHPIGWAKDQGYTYKPPPAIESNLLNSDAWVLILTKAFADAKQMLLPPEVLKDQFVVKPHHFEVGWKLEALHPIHRNQICPATVVELLSDKYFVIKIDDLRNSEDAIDTRLCCHSQSPGIFPIQWCMGSGIKLTHPKGWHRPDFQWLEYLAYRQAYAAPDYCFGIIHSKPEHQFQRAMKLEAVNPANSNQICAATITKISGRLLWLHLDSSITVVPSHIEDIESHRVFPVGWCESNGYQLKPPHRVTSNARSLPVHTLGLGKRVAIVQPEKQKTTADGSNWCPKIYFNHRCFSGPFLSKGRLSELPKSVGPGPIVLVLKEVLTLLISVAYKSSRVLRELQLTGTPNPKMFSQILKAKYKGKYYRAVVEICRSPDQLDEFCRQACIKLECCPNLISPHCVDNSCPESCTQLTKTKYNYYYGKKKRGPGRPPGGHTNLEDGCKKIGRRRKKGKPFIHRKIRIMSAPVKGEPGLIPDQEEDKGSSGSETRTENRRKYNHRALPPPSDIQTRGVKLPKYNFDRMTHRKLLPRVQPTDVVGSPPVKRKRGRPPNNPQPITPISQSQVEGILELDSNPLEWSVNRAIQFIKTTDCANLARHFKEQEIDGQALLLLTLPTVQEHLELKLGPAIKLCHQIERVKIAFYETYA